MVLKSEDIYHTMLYHSCVTQCVWQKKMANAEWLQFSVLRGSDTSTPPKEEKRTTVTPVDVNWLFVLAHKTLCVFVIAHIYNFSEKKVPARFSCFCCHIIFIHSLCTRIKSVNSKSQFQRYYLWSLLLQAIFSCALSIPLQHLDIEQRRKWRWVRYRKKKMKKSERRLETPTHSQRYREPDYDMNYLNANGNPARNV